MLVSAMREVALARKDLGWGADALAMRITMLAFLRRRNTRGRAGGIPREVLSASRIGKIVYSSMRPVAIIRNSRSRLFVYLSVPVVNLCALVGALRRSRMLQATRKGSLLCRRLQNEKLSSLTPTLTLPTLALTLTLTLLLTYFVPGITFSLA